MPEKYVEINVKGMCSDNDKSQGNVVFNRRYDYRNIEDPDAFRTALNQYIKDADMKGLRPVSIAMERIIVRRIQE